ncbi:hypothetical protein [Brevibacillus centrosporus]|uniref:hypothetical protein n=1 Tax=Brevibacillus centrosporus TaxID=54910 RepID=UPI003B02B1AE
MKRNPQHDVDPSASPWVEPNLENFQIVVGGMFSEKSRFGIVTEVVTDFRGRYHGHIFGFDCIFDYLEDEV